MLMESFLSKLHRIEQFYKYGIGNPIFLFLKELEFMLEKNVYKLNEKFNLLMAVNDNDKKRFNDIVSWCGTLLELGVKQELSARNEQSPLV